MSFKDDLLELLKTGDDDDLSSLRDGLLKIPPEEQIKLDITEDRVNGKYMRCMIAPAGTLIVGDVHATEDDWEVLAGEIHVRELGHEYKLLKKGDKGTGKAGTFRIGITETDTLFMNTCSIPEWVGEGCEYDYLTGMSEWGLFLKRWGLTEEMIQEQMDSRDICDHGCIALTVEQSKVHGEGLFPMRRVLKGEFLGNANYGVLYTALGRFVNHSSKPNIEFDFGYPFVRVTALRDIEPMEELFVDYNRNGEELMKGKLECPGQR